jgi:BCCIP
MKQLRAYLLRKVPAGRERTTLTRLLDEPHSETALFINERVVNMPAEIVPGLQESILADLEWARTKASIESERVEFSNLKNVLMIVPRFQISSTGKDKKKVVEHGYYHFEEEVFAAAADDLSFSFPVALPDSTGVSSGSVRTVPNSSDSSAETSGKMNKGKVVAKKTIPENFNAEDPTATEEMISKLMEDDGDDTSMKHVGPLRPPLNRLVINFSMDSLPKCIEHILDLVARAAEKEVTSITKSDKQ